MNNKEECDYVTNFRKKFNNNAIEFDALMVEMLADNKRFIGYLNYLGIDPMNGSPTAEEIVGMRIQTLQRTVDYKQAKIDSLMLEYCPDEMSKEQVQEWEKNQVKSDVCIHELLLPKPSSEDPQYYKCYNCSHVQGYKS